MRLTRMSLRGFGPVRDATLEFDPSAKVVIISGENGMGKSTIFDSFRLNVLDTYDGALREYIGWNDARFESDIEFILRGKRVRSIVSCDGAGAERTVTVEGDAEVYRNSEAVKKLARLLDPKRFLAVSFAKQHELDIIDTGPAERREYLKRLHDLTFSKPIKYLDGRLSASELRASGLRGEIKTLSEREYSLMDPRELPLAPQTLVEKKTDVEAAGLAISSIRQDKKSLAEAELSLPRLEESVVAKKGRLTEAASSVEVRRSDLDVVASDSELASGTASRDEALAVALAQLDATIARQLSAVDAAEAEEVRVPAYDAEAYDDATSRLGGLLSDQAHAVKSKRLAEQGTCPECGRPFEAGHVAHVAEDIERIDAEIASLRAEIAIMSSQKKAHDDAVVGNQTAAKKAAALRGALIDKSSETARLVKARDDAVVALEKNNATRLAAAQALLDAAASALAEASRSLAEETSRLDTAKKSVSDLRLRLVGSDDTLSALEDRKRTAQAEVDTQAAVEAYNFAVAENNERVGREKAADLARFGEATLELADAEELRARLDAARDILRKELPSFIIARLVTKIEHHMNDFLECTYRGRYRVAIEESKDALKILYGPKRADVKRSSGYEKQAFSLAWKYAKERLDGVGVLFLDEVDSEASEANSKLFYQTVAGLPYEQIIAISHRPDTRAMLRADHGAQTFEVVDGEISG